MLFSKCHTIITPFPPLTLTHPNNLGRRYNGYFVDLYVRVGNTIAVRMYAALGYMVYRRVLEYYGEPLEDAFDMRKKMPRDLEGTSVIPLPAPTDGV